MRVHIPENMSTKDLEIIMSKFAYGGNDHNVVELIKKRFIENKQ